MEAVRNAVTPPPLPPDTIPEMLDYAADLSVNIAEMRKSPDGFLWEDLSPGDSLEAVPGSEVDLQYAGWLPDGSPVDSGLVTFTVGAEEALPGLDRGVIGMKAGGRRRLVLPPGLGYGAEGREGIPPNAVLVYQLLLLAVRP